MQINFKRVLTGDINSMVERVTEVLKTFGFGVLTRIDMHDKIESSLGKKIPKTIILGACNPTLAYEAIEANTDVASLLPCNVVIRETKNQSLSVEFVKPSMLMRIVGDPKLEELALKADDILLKALQQL